MLMHQKHKEEKIFIKKRTSDVVSTFERNIFKTEVNITKYELMFFV